MNAARLSSVVAQALVMIFLADSGYVLDRIVTSVPAATAARLHVIVITPANAGSA